MMPIVIRGAGDLATGIALRLYRAGFSLVMTDLPEPTAVRRTVSFSEAVRLGRTEVEGVGRGSVVVGMRGRNTVYGRMKEEMYKDLLAVLSMSEEDEMHLMEARMADRERRDEEDRRLVEKAKL